MLTAPTSKTGEIQPRRAALNGEATRKRRCVGAGGQVSGVLPGPGLLLPAEGGEAPEPGVPVPAAEQTDGLHLLRAGGERAALWYVHGLCSCVCFISAHASGELLAGKRAFGTINIL